MRLLVTLITLLSARASATEPPLSSPAPSPPAERSAFAWRGLDGHGFLALQRFWQEEETGPRVENSFRGSTGAHGALLAKTAWALGSLEARLALAFHTLDGRDRTAFGGTQGLWRVGLAEAALRLPLRLRDDSLLVEAGGFPWTANPDAAVLGEDFVRTEPYPSLATASDPPYQGLGRRQTPVRGARLAFGPAASGMAGMRHEAVLLFEPDRGETGYPLTAGYQLRACLPRGVELGGGFLLHRAVQPGGRPEEYHIIRSSGDTLVFTRRAIKIAARAAVDLPALAGLAAPAGEWRLFGEAALLGWKDIPEILPERRDRLALMAGLRLPTFGLLRELVVQGASAPALPNLSGDPGRPGWAAALLATRDLASWLSLQLLLRDGPGYRPGYFRPAGEPAPEPPDRPRERLGELRLEGRF